MDPRALRLCGLDLHDRTALQVGRDGRARRAPVLRRRAPRGDAAVRGGAGTGAGEARAHPGPLRRAHRPARRNRSARSCRAGARRRACGLARDPLRPGGDRPCRRPGPGRRSLRPFRRHQPGSARHRARAVHAGRRWHNWSRSSIEHAAPRPAWRGATPARRRWRERCCNRPLSPPSASAARSGRKRWRAAAGVCSTTPTQALAVSLGGAAGNLAAWGEAGPRLRAELASALGLSDPGATWHTQRDAWIGLAADAALATGAMAKIARDIALMAQAEVGEAAEPAAPGRGGSTAMPHKRNPVLCMRVLAAAQPVPGLIAGLLAAMPQEHERALGNWQAETAQFPDVLIHALSAATALAELLEGVQLRRGTLPRQHRRPAGDDLLGKPGRPAQPGIGQAGSAGAGGHPVHARDRRPGRICTSWPGSSSADNRLAVVSMADVDAIFDLDRAARVSAQQVQPMLEALSDS